MTTFKVARKDLISIFQLKITNLFGRGRMCILALKLERNISAALYIIFDTKFVIEYNYIGMI